MRQFFQRRAGLFVVAAWVLLLATVPIAILVGISVGINLTYHPFHRAAPFDRLVSNAVYVALGAAFAAASFSSFALAIKCRATASLLVVGCWFIFVGHTAVAWLITKPRPDYFDRQVGALRFRVPWQYAPLRTDHPFTAGLYVRVCFPSMKGAYDPRCRSAKQMSVMLPDREFAANSDIMFWSRRLSELTVGEVRNGHQEYTYIQRSPTDPKTMRFLSRSGSQGKLERFVVCRGFGTCTHLVRMEAYALSYETPEAEFANWETTDRKFAELVNSWRQAQ